MFEAQQRKLKRSAQLFSVLSKYGFQDLIIRLNGKTNSDETSSETTTLSLYERIKLTLEELGPTFVKLGQTFSNREDLLPLDLILELQKLQDNVKTIDLDIKEILSTELNINTEEHFQEIQTEPIAAASIAQVYKGILKDGSAIIIKVKRPGIDEIIKNDLLILKDLVKLIDTYSDFGDQINLKNAVNAFEKSLLEELSLTIEKHNIKQFASNYKNNTETYVPIIYDDYCTDSILTMEFIDGIKITDIDALKANNINPATISEAGYRLFISQILDFGFFHADPHAGNILVKKDGKIVFIDFGVVGKIQANDKEELENLILNFLAKRPDKIVKSLKKIAIYYNIPDERKLENDVSDILNFIHNTSLKDISVADIIEKMKEVLKENRLVMPDYFYLLFKGISLIDGVGRTINPDLDVVKSLKPYTQKILLKRLNPERFARKGWDKTLDFVNNLEEIPKEFRSIINKLDDNKFTINTEIKNIDRIENLVKASIINLILSFVLSANIIATSILWANDVGPKVGSLSLLPLFGILFSLILIIVLITRLLRR